MILILFIPSKYHPIVNYPISFITTNSRTILDHLHLFVLNIPTYYIIINNKTTANMKFSAAILAATAASAATITRRQADSYSVSEFSASCIPHSELCSYHFDVLASSGAGTPVACDALVMGPDDLPAVPLTACAGAYYSFSVAHSNTTGLELTVTTPLGAGTNVTGYHHIDAADIVPTRSGAVTTEAYTGATSFDVPAVVVRV